MYLVENFHLRFLTIHKYVKADFLIRQNYVKYMQIAVC